MKYAYYHIDGSKANEFKAESQKLFSNPELKKEMQERFRDLDRETMSFNLYIGTDCPKEILELAVKYGEGKNSFA